MHERMERLALDARRALGLAWDEVPTLERCEALIEAEGSLRLCYDSTLRLPYYEPPEVLHLPPRCRTEDLAHEWAHHLRGDGLAALLRLIASRSGDVRLGRAAESCRRIEEAGAQAFVTALWLPAQLLLSADDYQVAELTGWNIDTIRGRRYALHRWQSLDPERFRRVWFQWLGVL